MSTASFDLTQKLIPFLDRHLVLPLLAHLSEAELFPAEQIARAQYELVKETNMLDYAAQLFEDAYPDEPVPEMFAAKREKAVSEGERLQQEAQFVLDVIEKPEVAQALRQDKMQNLQYLKDNYNVTLEQITALYNFGQFQYTTGNYSGASDYLYHFRILSTNPDLLLSAHWGKLAGDILTGAWDRALEELSSLRETLDSRSAPTPALTSTSSAPLTARAWLLHWSLFICISKNVPNGPQTFLDMALAPAYLNTIQVACPWLLRYVSAAAVLVSRHRDEVVRVVQMEAYQYSDPITRFLTALYVDFDFEGAREALGAAEGVLEADFFLGTFASEFVDAARCLISEAYCRVHQTINIAELSDRLNMSRDEGEKWIVNLIRDTKMGTDAKIDLKKNEIHIARAHPPVYQTIIEKTRGLAFRTQVLGVAMSKRAAGEEVETSNAGKRGGDKRRVGGTRREREDKAEAA
ncbi:eukaryotic translation initiation factor 3 subunit E [Ceratobasidium sp. 394]|nr:eukaryotic translation initiation factor 3 subunit E [Ceratobasidium sp. 394]KAG8708159.1 eukaryotic translation initiation factor 3 subunit E [Ceratobasidium sp. 394]KAG9090802.1 eukaryotic translation initiation factor 3 subunit E [Ceratobasidium sp. UAMH 11750]